MVGVRLQPDLLEVLERYLREVCAPGTSRPEAVRLALRDWATKMGLLNEAD